MAVVTTGRGGDEEIARASAALGLACRTIMDLTLDARDPESIAAAVHAIDTLIDEVRAAFRHNAEVVGIADDLKRGLREALWAESEFTRQ